MLPDLKDTLYRILPPPRAELINDAMDELEAVGYVMGAGEVYQLWSGSYECDTAKMIGDTELILSKCLRSLISLYGITLNVFDLPTLVKVAKRVRHLDESIEHEIINGILDKEDDGAVMLAELLAIPFGESWLKFIDVIAIVSDEFSERLREAHTITEEEIVVPFDMTLLKRFVGNNRSTVAERMIRDLSYLPGTTIDISCEQYKAYLQGLCPDHKQDCATEFVGMAILEGVSQHEVITEALDAAGTFYKDPDFILSLRQEMSTVLNRMSTHG